MQILCKKPNRLSFLNEKKKKHNHNQLVNQWNAIFYPKPYRCTNALICSRRTFLFFFFLRAADMYSDNLSEVYSCDVDCVTLSQKQHSFFVSGIKVLFYLFICMFVIWLFSYLCMSMISIDVDIQIVSSYEFFQVCDWRQNIFWASVCAGDDFASILLQYKFHYFAMLWVRAGDGDDDKKQISSLYINTSFVCLQMIFSNLIDISDEKKKKN